jgi:hypothetical protein
VFYTTFLVLFYVLILQRVTAKDLPEKYSKNGHKKAQKLAQKCAENVTVLFVSLGRHGL